MMPQKETLRVGGGCQRPVPGLGGGGRKLLQGESRHPLWSRIRSQTWCLGATEGPTRLPLPLLVEASTEVAGQASLTYVGSAKRHKPDLPELGRPISSPYPSGMGLSVASSMLLPGVLSLGPNGDKAPLLNLPMVAKASLRSTLRSTAHLALGLYSQDHYSQGLLLFPRWSSLRVRALLSALYSCSQYHA